MAQVSEDTSTTITTVDCPDVKAEAGSTFECTATNDEGIEFVLKVTQTDDQGHVVYGYEDAEPAAPRPLDPSMREAAPCCSRASSL